MRKLFWITLLAVATGVFSNLGFAQNDTPLIAEDASISSACTVYYSRPDIRMCVTPDCGGDWLFELHQGQDPCLDDLQVVQYVTGIFIREKDGRLTRIFPACNQPLTGSIEPDPDHPGYEILVYLACV